MKLGEIFIQQRLINETQLKDALHAQLIYGGHLGTCLIEMGHIDEDQLGRVLADVMKVPYAAFDRFQDIPRAVIQLIPARVVEKLYAIPFAKHDKTVSVAMIDPKDLPALDEISFVMGCKMEPWVSPEVRILQAMERYYDIPRRQRYISVSRELDVGWNNREARLSGNEASPARTAVAAEETPPAGQPSPAAQVATAVAPAAPINWKTIKEDMPRNPDDQVSDRLCSADTVEALAEAVLDSTSGRLERCMLFSVKSTTAVLWSSRNLGLDRSLAQSLRFTITSEPIFQLFTGEGLFQGPLPDDPACRGFYEKMDVRVPSEILMMPIHLEDRLVAILYGDGGTDSKIQGTSEDYRRLGRKISIALNIVLLKRKLHSL
jgi:hypothetical protein